MRIAWQSLRFRVPLSLVAVILVTSLFLSVAIGVQTRFNLEADQVRSLTAQAYALSPILSDAVLHDDVWTAYTALHGPKGAADGEDPDRPYHLVIDEQQRIFVTDRPERFPLGEPLDTPAEGRALAVLLRHPGGDRDRPRAIEYDGRQILIAPLSSEDSSIATLVIAGPRGAIQKRQLEILQGGLLVMLVLLLLITPFGWAWGTRMVRPLVRLAECMRRVGKDPIDQVRCPVYAGQDEIGQLARVFQSMLAELHEKQALERQMLTQDRLAAIGRIAGGVAHEINNPLSGMLVAIDTYRESPPERQNPEKTLQLIERGLTQIRDTVSALLVECRIERRQCTAEDIEDIHRLALTNPAARRAKLDWRYQAGEAIALPATAVRQILLNLVLNALQAAAEAEPAVARVEIQTRDRQLLIDTWNTGRPIPQAILEHIFEPFHSSREGGTGLGLWISYQVVTQLDGEIIASSDEDWTHFHVTLPFLEPEDP